MSNEGKYEVYIPSENKTIRGDHGITAMYTSQTYSIPLITQCDTCPEVWLSKVATCI